MNGILWFVIGFACGVFFILAVSVWAATRADEPRDE